MFVPSMYDEFKKLAMEDALAKYYHVGLFFSFMAGHLKIILLVQRTFELKKQRR